MNKNQQITTISSWERQIRNYEDLFQLWKEIPVVRKLSDESLYRATKHPIQNAILKILREGIIDKNGKKRNFLIANELLEYVNQDLEGIDKTIKISMLYYHLDKLQESDLVNYVFYIEGRHKRKYFGRTAKFYLFGDENKDKKSVDKHFEPISKLILHFNPDVNIKKYQEVVKIINQEQSEFSNALVNWMELNHELLYELDIDPLDLFSIMSNFMVRKSSMQKLFSELTPYMKFLE